MDDGIALCPTDGTKLVTPFRGMRILEGKYRLEQKLGGGGMGVVYRAQHMRLQKTFAVKLIQPSKMDSAFQARFEREAEVLGRLKHSNIVEVTDYGIDAGNTGLPYLVMEYLEGTNLHDYCRLKGPLAPEEAIPIFASIARAIDYAHDHGILHRDLKSDNVLVGRGGDSKRLIKIVDFGLARFLDRLPLQEVTPGRSSASHESAESFTAGMETVQFVEEPAQPSAGSITEEVAEVNERLTRHGTLLGTLAYMAPEVIEGKEASPASDIYALGILMYEVMTGKTPFAGTRQEIFNAHLRSEAEKPSARNTSVPRELDAPILSCLAKDPAKRPETAGAIVAEIRKLAAEAGIRAWRKQEFPRRTASAAVLVILISIVVTLLLKLPPLNLLEMKTVDVRFLFAHSKPPDPRILVVMIDDASVDADPKPLAQRSPEFASLLQRVFDAGAVAVGIDVTIPDLWNQSEAFSRFVLQNSGELTLAVQSGGDQTYGPGALGGLTAAALGPEKAEALFGFVNLEVEDDGITRRMRCNYLDTKGNQRKAWASRVASSSKNFPKPPDTTDLFWIDYSVSSEKIPIIRWKDLDAELIGNPQKFKQRIVLVGGNYTGSGDQAHRIPHTFGGRKDVPGVIVHALILNTILARFPLKEISPVPFFLISILTAFALSLAFLIAQNQRVVVLSFSAAVLLYTAAAFLLFAYSLKIAPLLLFWLIAGLACLGAQALRRTSLKIPGRRSYELD